MLVLSQGTSSSSLGPSKVANHISRKETFTFLEADYTPGSWTVLKLSRSIGKSGDIHRVVLMQSALNAAGGAAAGGAMDTRIVNGYYDITTVGSTVPARDVAWEDLASVMAPNDLVASADFNVAATGMGALYSAIQRRPTRVGQAHTEQSEVVGVAIKPLAGTTGTITITVYAYVNS